MGGVSDVIRKGELSFPFVVWDDAASEGPSSLLGNATRLSSPLRGDEVRGKTGLFSLVLSDEEASGGGLALRPLLGGDVTAPLFS